jgi:hypothetical protein
MDERLHVAATEVGEAIGDLIGQAQDFGTQVFLTMRRFLTLGETMLRVGIEEMEKK